MVLRLSGFEIFKFNANLGTVQWVLSVFTMVLFKKIFTGFPSFFLVQNHLVNALMKSNQLENKAELPISNSDEVITFVCSAIDVKYTVNIYR
jgi:hypothetical protein